MYWLTSLCLWVHGSLSFFLPTQAPLNHTLVQTRAGFPSSSRRPHYCQTIRHLPPVPRHQYSTSARDRPRLLLTAVLHEKCPALISKFQIRVLHPLGLWGSRNPSPSTPFSLQNGRNNFPTATTDQRGPIFQQVLLVTG